MPHTGHASTPADALLATLTHPSLYLLGDGNGGVSIHCRHHYDVGRPLAYYDRAGSAYPDPAVVNVATIPGLWTEAVQHLAHGHVSS